jgi:ubiquinone/menaquinone biosynthesis C-methylase UbiE
MKINIGSGFDKREGFTNIDNSVEVKPDLVCDLDKERLPFADNSVEFVLSVHSLEHFSQPVKVIEELYRVSKNGAVWKFEVPFSYSHQDTLFHKTVGWHHGSWDKFLTNSPRQYYTKVRLRLLKAEGISHGILRFLPFRRKLSSLFNNIYYSIQYELEVVK